MGAGNHPAVSTEALQTLGGVAARGGMLPVGTNSLEDIQMRQMMMQMGGGAGAGAHRTLSGMMGSSLGGAPGSISALSSVGLGGAGLSTAGLSTAGLTSAGLSTAGLTSAGLSGTALSGAAQGLAGTALSGAAQGLAELGAASRELDSRSQASAIQKQIDLIQRLQAQQMADEARSGLGSAAAGLASMGDGPALQRMKLEHPPKSQLQLEQERQHQQQEQQKQQLRVPTPQLNVGTDANGVPKTIAAHTHLLELSDPDGSRLRSYYRLSVDEIFGFPPTPTDEDYCTRLNIPGMTPRMIPGTHLAALSAARFAEVALGAIVHNEIPLAMELCNAVVHCLKESVQEPVQPPYMFEVARSYFLLAVFRSFRGDMVRYFKYRRVCLTYVSKLDVRNECPNLNAVNVDCKDTQLIVPKISSSFILVSSLSSAIIRVLSMLQHWWRQCLFSMPGRT